MGFPLLLLLPLLASIFSIILAIYLAKYVTKQDPGNEAMQTVAGYIQDGAKAFLRRQYKTFYIFIAFIFNSIPKNLNFPKSWEN